MEIKFTKNTNKIFQSSFESFLTAKDVDIKHKNTSSEIKERVDTSAKEISVDVQPPEKKKRGRKPAHEVQNAPERLEDLQNGECSIETAHNKWGQNCENCPALVHLMYNHLMEIADGKHHPIQYGTPSNEIIEHLSEGLGYNVRQIQRMIKMGQCPYRCRYCTAAYASKIELQKHMMQLHADIKTIPCLECEKMFHSQDNLRAHVATAHKPKPKKEYPCPVDKCDKEYVSLKMLKRHVNKIHSQISLTLNLPEAVSASEVSYTNQKVPFINSHQPTIIRSHGKNKKTQNQPLIQQTSDSESDVPIDPEDDEFLVNTESSISSDDEDDMDYVEERF